MGYSLLCSGPSSRQPGKICPHHSDSRADWHRHPAVALLEINHPRKEELGKMRLDKAFTISVISLLVIGVSLAIARAEAPPAPAPQVWSGWVGKVSDSTCGATHKVADAKQCTLECVRNGAKYALIVGEPAAKVYTLDGNASDFEPLAGAMAKVQGDLNGTTVKVTTAEPHR
jgi:hypothetical protein